MFCLKVCEKFYSEAARITQQILDKLSVIRELVKKHGPDALDKFAAMSWPTSSDRLSTKVEITKACLGTDDESKIANALPAPAKPNATKGDDIFSTAFSAEQRAEGRSRLRSFNAACRASKFAVHMRDCNTQCYVDTKETHHGDLDQKRTISTTAVL